MYLMFEEEIIVSLKLQVFLQTVTGYFIIFTNIMLVSWLMDESESAQEQDMLKGYRLRKDAILKRSNTLED